MPISARINESIEKSSWIRKMFEEGARLIALHGAENVFDFSLGNPDLNPPIEFFDVLKDILEKPGKGAHGYMPNAGYDEVRASIAKKVSREHGVEVAGKNVVMTCGAAGGLNVVLKAILNPGDQVIVSRPYFVEYGFYIDNHRGEIVLADSNPDFSLNAGNIAGALTEKTRAVLINTPNNPTGVVYPEANLKDLAKVLKDYSQKTGRIIYLIADEPYREIVYDGIVVPPLLKQYDESIVVTSYSKTLSIPGERIGYIAVNPSSRGVDSLMGGLILSNRILGFVNAPALMQKAVARLNDVAVNVNAYKKRRDMLMDGLKFAGYEFVRPDGAFYLFCKSPMKDDVEFVKHLLKFNILAVPGVGFGGPGHFRLAYCVSESVIVRAIPKFKEAMDSL